MSEARRIAAEFTPEAMQTLIRLARNPRLAPMARLAALHELLDRGLGKPRQAIEVTHETTHTEEYRITLDVLADPDAAALADALAARLAGLPRGVRGAPDGRALDAGAAPDDAQSVARGRGDGAAPAAPHRDAAAPREE